MFATIRIHHHQIICLWSFQTFENFKPHMRTWSNLRQLPDFFLFKAWIFIRQNVAFSSSSWGEKSTFRQPSSLSVYLPVPRPCGKFLRSQQVLYIGSESKQRMPRVVVRESQTTWDMWHVRDSFSPGVGGCLCRRRWVVLSAEWFLWNSFPSTKLDLKGFFLRKLGGKWIWMFPKIVVPPNHPF